jgi:cytochrome P450
MVKFVKPKFRVDVVCNQISVSNLKICLTGTMLFGLGIHFCLGAPLARLEGEIAFNTLLRRLPDLQLATEELKWVPSTAFRALMNLPVAFAV